MSDKRFRVAILDDFEKLADTVPAYEKLKVRADVTILRERLDSPEKIERTLKEMDALLLMRERTYFSDNEYNRLPNLKLISQTGRTSRHLDLPSATRRGIAVTGTPADNGTSTKELTIALILALMRKIPEVDRRMRRRVGRQWQVAYSKERPSVCWALAGSVKKWGVFLKHSIPECSAIPGH